MSARFVIVLGIAVGVFATGALMLRLIGRTNEPDGEAARVVAPEPAPPPEPNLPPVPAAPRLDQYGDPLPPGVICRIGADRFRGDYSSAIAFSADGSTVLTVRGKSVRSWDARTGRAFPARAIEPDGPAPAYPPRPHVPGEPDPTFTPDGNLFGEYWVWNLSEPRPKTIRVPKHENAPGRIVSVSLDGTRGAIAWPLRTVLWDLVNDRLVEELVVWPQFDPNSRRSYRADVFFSRDGKSLVVHNGEGLSIRRADTGKEIRFVPLPSDKGTFAVSGDLRLAATGNDSKPIDITVWDLTAGKQLHTMACAGWNLHRLCFSPDGTRLAGTGQNWVGVWAPAEGRELARWDNDGKNRGSALAFSPDGRTFATATGYGVHLYDADTATSRHPVPGWGDWFGRARLSADGTRVITTGSAGLRVWDIATGQLIEQPDAPFPPALDLSADGSVLAGVTRDGEIQVWDVRTRKQLPALADLPKGSYSGVLSPDGEWLDLRIANDRTSPEWLTFNTKTGRKTTTSPTGEFSSYSTVVPQRVVSGKERELEVWDVPTGKRRLHLTNVEPWAYAGNCAWLPNGKEVFVAVESENRWRRWNLETGAELAPLEFPEFFAKNPGRMSRGGRILFLPGWNRVVVQDQRGRGFTVWDLKTKKALKSWEGVGWFPWDFALSADGKRLIASGGYMVLVWDLEALLEPRG